MRFDLWGSSPTARPRDPQQHIKATLIRDLKGCLGVIWGLLRYIGSV